MDIDEQEALKLIEQHEYLIDHINKVLAKISKFDSTAPYDCSDTIMDIDQCRIYFEWTTEEGCRGCYDTVFHDYTLPIEYLWEDLDKIKAEKDEKEKLKKAEEKRIRAKRQDENRVDREKKEYEKFLKMKEKYEGGE